MRAVVSLFLLACAHCAQKSDSMDDLVKSIFDTSCLNTGKKSSGGSSATTPGPEVFRDYYRIFENVDDCGDTGNKDPIPESKPHVTGCQPGYECVPKYLCKDRKLIHHRVVTIRYGPDYPQPCPDYLQICCNTSKKTTEPIEFPRPAPEGCGFRNSNGIGGMRIIGDKHNESQYGEFPWMVAILEKDGNNYACGGSLIHPSVVLSAAHCVRGKQANTLKIRAGEWDTQTKNEEFPDQDREVSEFVTHEHYLPKYLFYDIALLFLKTPVAIAENVRTICLPPAEANFDKSRCIATGWGKDVFGREGIYQVILKKIDLPIVPQDQCEPLLGAAHRVEGYELHPSFLCAGGEIGRDMCTGDGGCQCCAVERMVGHTISL